MLPQSLQEPFLESPTPTYGKQMSLSGFAFLASTIVFEIAGTLSVRKADDSSIFFLIALAFYFTSLLLFTFTLREIPLSVAYTTWCAFGAIGVTVGSHVIFKEEISLKRLLCICMTVPFVVGMYIF